MKSTLLAASVCVFATSSFLAGSARGETDAPTCGETYSVVAGDTLSRISLRAYGSPLYQPIYTANLDVIGSNPDMIYVDQSLTIPCLAGDGAVVAVTEGRIVLTFNKASAPPFIINSGIVDGYLADITEATGGRVTFVDPEVINRDHGQQFELVTSGAVDGAYVLNSTIAESHPLLQLPMQPMFGGSAEQTAISLWRLHEVYLAQTDYFSEAELLGFIGAPAAHIWRDADVPVTAEERVAAKNRYATPYFEGLDTRGPAAVRAEVAQMMAGFAASEDEAPTLFMAHGAALALGIWSETATVSVMEVDNGLYTPTFSVVLSNDAWDRISPEDQAAIRAISGEALSYRSAAWDGFDNAFRSRMLEKGLDFKKADKALLTSLWLSSLDDLKAWMAQADALGVPSNEAVNFYLMNLRTFEDRLIYRGEETFVDEHPFVTGRDS